MAVRGSSHQYCTQSKPKSHLTCQWAFDGSLVQHLPWPSLSPDNHHRAVLYNIHSFYTFRSTTKDMASNHVPLSSPLKKGTSLDLEICSRLIESEAQPPSRSTFSSQQIGRTGACYPIDACLFPAVRNLLRIFFGCVPTVPVGHTSRRQTKGHGDHGRVWLIRFFPMFLPVFEPEYTI